MATRATTDRIAFFGLIGLALPGEPADSLLSLVVFVSALLVFQPVRRLARRIAGRRRREAAPRLQPVEDA